MRRDVRACAVARSTGHGHAVEQTHGPFGKDQLGALGIPDQPFDAGTVHRPTVKVERRTPRGGGVKGGVDIVWPAFERLHRNALRTQRGQQAQHQRGLTAARRRRRYQQAARDHSALSGKRGAVPMGRKRRS